MRREPSKQHCSLSDPSWTYIATAQLLGLPHTGEYLRLRPLQCNRYTETTNYGPNEEQIKTPEKELSDKERPSLSDAEFKTLVIRMLTEMVEYGHKIEEKVKAMQSEMKKNIQGINSKGKETRNQINDLEQNEEINIQPEQNEEIRIQKNEERLRNL